jgi:hypothetical protein
MQLLPTTYDLLIEKANLETWIRQCDQALSVGASCQARTRRYTHQLRLSLVEKELKRRSENKG